MIHYTFNDPKELAEYLRKLAEKVRTAPTHTKRGRLEADATARGMDDAANIVEASTFTGDA